MIAYDLDGTILLSPVNNIYLKKIFWKVNPKIDKNDVHTIITARTTSWLELTWLTCKIIGLNKLHTIIFNPENNWTVNYISNWKYRVLTEYGFDTYIDNDRNMLIRIRLNGFQGVLKNV